jgi:hypothetical protein
MDERERKHQEEEGEKKRDVVEATRYWDVLVHCGNMDIKCSSFILNTRSEYFEHVITTLTSLDEGIYLEEVSLRHDNSVIYFSLIKCLKT